MNFVPFSDAVKRRYGGHASGALIREFPLGTAKLDLACADIVGRFPETDMKRNQACTLIAHVLQGSGEITIEGEVQKLSKGDTLLIPPQKKYFWRGAPTLFLVIASSPPWDSKQCETIP
jgi:hypothetical protein